MEKKEQFFLSGEGRALLWCTRQKEGTAYPYTETKNQGNGKELRMDISLRRGISISRVGERLSQPTEILPPERPPQ